MIDQFSADKERYPQDTEGTVMLTIRAIDIQNSRQQDVLEIYISSESKKEICLKVRVLPDFTNHPWITSDLVMNIINKMGGPQSKRALDEKAHQLAHRLGEHAPARWTVRVAKVKR